MATKREYINAIMFSGMLDCLPAGRVNDYLKNAAKLYLVKPIDEVTDE